MSTPPRFFNLEESDMGRFIGVDLHRNCFTVCLIAENGREYLSEYRLDNIDRFLDRLRETDEVAVEVTGNTRLFHDLVAPHVGRVAVVNPSEFRVIRQSTKKTDKHDARALALFLSKDLLPEVRMKDKQHAELASLTQTRDALVKQRTALKNKVNNLLSSRGVNLKKESLASEKGLREVLGMKFAPLMEFELEVLVEQIRAINTSVAKLENTIKKEGAKLPGHKNLKSIKGIGDLGATILLSVIGDVDDFANEGKLAAYFGIVPRVSNSNETQHSGRITKRGTKLGRTTLVQCALIAKRYSPLHVHYFK
jgi:transposase